MFSLLHSNAKEDFISAQILEEKGDIRQALKYYLKSANSKNEKALLYLGKIYFEGKLINRSIPKAIAYLEKAILLGSIQAKYNLAIIYASKHTIKYRNYTKAYNIFLELAQKGHAPSQNKIGIFFTYGIGGIKKDYTKAIRWFEASAKQCYEDAECNLASMYIQGKGVWRNFGRAHIFAKKGYENNNPICKSIWKEYNLFKYPEDKSFKFNFFVEPCNE